MTDPRKLIHSPQQLATRLIQEAERRVEATGVQWGIPEIDEKVIPMRPGDLVALVGRPGSGKSSVASQLCRTEAKRIVERGADREIVVYFTWEQSVEELEAFFQADDIVTTSDVAWGRADMDWLINEKQKARWRIPIWAVGHSVNDPDTMRLRLTIDVAHEALRVLKEEGWDVRLAAFDYAQIIPSRRGADSRIQEVHEATILTKELAVTTGIPIIFNAQARQEVDDYDPPMPTSRDAQWCSSIFQTTDKYFALMRPITFTAKGEWIEVGGKSYLVDDALLVVKMWKQRFDSPFGLWALSFNPATMEWQRALSYDELKSHIGGSAPEAQVL